LKNYINYYRIKKNHSRFLVLKFFLFFEFTDSAARNQRNQITATLGLVVHAAADGIALGASATTKHLEMEMIVFFAIMLHKVLPF
jgi:zinc transporter ZupT